MHTCASVLIWHHIFKLLIRNRCSWLVCMACTCKICLPLAERKSHSKVSPCHMVCVAVLLAAFFLAVSLFQYLAGRVHDPKVKNMKVRHSDLQNEISS